MSGQDAPIKWSRCWAMPSADTFTVKPIGEFVKRYVESAKVSVDPFARNNTWTTYTNDLNPETTAMFHLDAEEFLIKMAQDKIVADVVVMDPPYSPRQISECYKSVGKKVGMKETQSACLYQRVRDAVVPICRQGTIVLSFGWNTVGMGKGRGFEIIEVMLVCHGGAHNDTICMAERENLMNGWDRSKQKFWVCRHDWTVRENPSGHFVCNAPRFIPNEADIKRICFASDAESVRKAVDEIIQTRGGK